MSEHINAAIGPRKVGGRYYNGYWGQEYTVKAISRRGANDFAGWSITVIWDDGRTTTHCTAWDDRDRVIAQP